jgi:ligand-binding SRPBCC domain-containing protein
MPFIHLTTFIGAPQQRVFDLSRSIELHKHSMTHHAEKIIEGTMNGLMNLGDTVTWQAKHLAKERIMKIRITKLQRPDYFVDEQEQGDFALLKHEHYFKPVENGTIMIDQFHFETPHGLFGKMINRLYLKKYMIRLLEERNEVIRKAAESNQWKQYLNE